MKSYPSKSRRSDAPKKEKPRFSKREEERRLPPTLNSMIELLRRSEIKLNKEQIHQLWSYHNLLRARNTDQELTRIIGFEPIIIKHYVDCMIVGKFLAIPSPIVDVGTGAGFPGIPLKIRYPHLKITLAEPRPKRIAFLKEVIHTLKLKNVDVFEHKVVSRSFKTPMKAVITRAVETIDKTMLRTSGCLEVGGKLIFLKGPAVDPEISEVRKRFGQYFRLTLDKRYELPHTGHSRRLVIYEKLKDFELTKNVEEHTDFETESN
ncbi:MAG: 16S rRNA (guanine(527)-N(7))-methyltransferase RsmG [Deltaproteobacteria bacterium]|nr:16S rRNA (guanine(527)-N(7))-methyltransferase RsmG [Deltaproteobacteria bacterium]MBM4317596.1 16S rRNA (guanine(527)-N(7))-methyltransferase RsmG [Deltaproteobacteria bacterium]